MHPVVILVSGFSPHLSGQLGGAYPGRVRLSGGFSPVLFAPSLGVVQLPLQVVLHEQRVLPSAVEPVHCTARALMDSQACSLYNRKQGALRAVGQCKYAVAK